MYDLLSADIGEKKYGNVIAEVAFIPSGFVEYAYIPPSPFDGRRLPTQRAIERAKVQLIISSSLISGRVLAFKGWLRNNIRILFRENKI